MSLPPAAMTKPETSYTTSHSLDAERGPHRRDLGPVGLQVADSLGKLGGRLASVEDGHLVPTGEERLDQPLADEHRTAEDQRPHHSVLSSRPTGGEVRFRVGLTDVGS